MSKLAKSIRNLGRRLGVEISRSDGRGPYPSDFSQLGQDICRTVEPYTMTPPVKVNALVEAVQYVVKSEVNGAFVECGVWKGGSAMAMALTLKSLGADDRALYLYDTFTGMTKPGEVDISMAGKPASVEFTKTRTGEDSSAWCLSPLDEVKANVRETGYPDENLHFVEGKVEDTIPQTAPEMIAILRLDTDWYESTKHELVHLFPRLQPGGVLILDDYGYWQGARKAVDEYIAENNLRIFLNRLDHTGRIAVKM